MKRICSHLGANSFPLRAAETSLEMRSRVNCPGFITVCSQVLFLSIFSHKTESSSWLPPRENWDPGNSNMPYGWEEGIDKNNKPYFIK